MRNSPTDEMRTTTTGVTRRQVAADGAAVGGIPGVAGVDMAPGLDPPWSPGMRDVRAREALGWG